MKTQIAIDVYKHTFRDAIRALAESQAQDAVLTWDGEDNYRVQSKHHSLDEGHEMILPKSDLVDQFMTHGDEDDITASAEWLRDNRHEWFRMAQDTEN